MQDKELMRQYAAGERDFNNSTLSEANLVKTSLSGEKVDGEKLDGSITPEDAMLLAPICFLAMTSVILFLKLSNACKTAQNRITTLKTFHQFPCKNCRFFTDKHYLKCAVHPYTVLKQEAINCPDYWSRDSKFSK